VCVQTHTHNYTYMHVSTHTRTHTRARARARTHTHTHTHTHTYIYTYTYRTADCRELPALASSAPRAAHTCAALYWGYTICIYIHTHTHTHTHIHTYTRTHTHTHTHDKITHLDLISNLVKECNSMTRVSQRESYTEEDTCTRPMKRVLQHASNVSFLPSNHPRENAMP